MSVPGDTPLPVHDIYTVVHTLAGTYADLAITTDGSMYLYDSRSPAVTDPAFVSLEGISYPRIGGVADPDPSQPLALNTVNWSANVTFPVPPRSPTCVHIRSSTAPPGWFIDGSGTVHLEGDPTEVSGNGGSSNPSLLGVLPMSVAPGRWVYTIAATNNGTYTDLVINPQGQIFLISPRPPMARDYSFISLDGISYQR